MNVKDKPFFGFSLNEFLILLGGVGGGAAVYDFVLGWIPVMPIRLIIPLMMGLIALAVVFIKPKGQTLIAWLRDRRAFAKRPQLAIFGLHELQAAQAQHEQAAVAAQIEILESDAIFDEIVRRDAAEFSNQLPLLAAAWERQPATTTASAKRKQAKPDKKPQKRGAQAKTV